MIILRYMNSAKRWEIKPRIKLSLLNKNKFFLEILSITISFSKANNDRFITEYCLEGGLNIVHR